MQQNVLWLFFIVTTGLFWTPEASTDSCPISSQTVVLVKGCPDTEEKRREAAARKNCSAFASQCSEPKRLVYHCVINEFINETLEVCAYAQNILFGCCTEYSISGNLLQQNTRTNCTMFTTNPCPVFYRSTDAYKYPNCYDLTKTSTDSNFPGIKSTYPTTPTNISQENTQEDNNVAYAVFLDVIVGSLVLISLCIVVVVLYRQKYNCIKNDKELENNLL